MTTAGIISEYNPFHLGHAGHIRQTRELLGDDCAIMCLMSGNFVQRGDFAVFSKHARARAAVLSGADLVIELPVPYVLSSAEGFAKAGVDILTKTGVCDNLSFGSESGQIESLAEAAEALASETTQKRLREWMDKGLSYATAMQKTAGETPGMDSEVIMTPNNLLGIEYIKAINKTGSPLKPMTCLRTGGSHDGTGGFSASWLRSLLEQGFTEQCLVKQGFTEQVLTEAVLTEAVLAKPILTGHDFEELRAYMPEAAYNICIEEILALRGPVFSDAAEQAILSRLRAMNDFSRIQGVSEGLDRRFLQYATTEPSVSAVLEKIKTKRYSMSRLRRVLLCACLGLYSDAIPAAPPYIRVLATNSTGMLLLKKMRKKARLPVIIKPASARRLSNDALRVFNMEAAATDFYVLAYPGASNRAGGGEWKQTPVIV